MRTYDLVIFDVDGTLLNTTEGVLASVNDTIEAYDLDPLTKEQLLSFIGPPIQDSFRRHYGIEGRRLQELADYFRDSYKNKNLLKAVPYEGIYKLCEVLIKEGAALAVATYKREDYARSLLIHFGFDRFTGMLYGADNENRLRKKDIINKCIDTAGIKDLGRAVMIGDSDNDAIGAAGLGIDFLGVTYGFGFRNQEEVRRFPAIGAADSPEAVLDYLVR
ncbi:HAD hydrolase-like protein [Murimonas intestini]|uniref:Phosphoglycolate phosphatase n=1 Tax=Murimonas intestini TaxID=1337051 RepID=A0AB73T952_9FIRM|nr:HAD hydrolase-like protein [Murimonas intestini]MCR1839485.1 HAD hydrolase-like protein [Murimonas intestini]MCR1867972.1 HAD hydrolase-like protein [Murimonas intestini]MCR1882390.1 HAD hydrolase-like protein [Murimonas intestini]